MKRQIKKTWQSLLLATITTVIVFGASTEAFGQKSLNEKYPKPDFSAMEEYWEVVSFEYDFTGNGVPSFTVLAKKKERNVPRKWMVTWYDADGVKVDAGPLLFDNGNRAEIGEPVRTSAYAPFKRYMSRVKTIKVTEIID